METNKTNQTKTITIDVNDESYDKGWSDGYIGCSHPPQELYLGQTAKYWSDFFIGLFPLVIFLFVFFVVFRRIIKRQEEYYAKHYAYTNEYAKKYDLSTDRQQKAIEIMEQTNKLLAEISQKLDTK